MVKLIINFADAADYYGQMSVCACFIFYLVGIQLSSKQKQIIRLSGVLLGNTWKNIRCMNEHTNNSIKRKLFCSYFFVTEFM